MISGSLNSFPYSFVTQKEIRKPEDLVGKKIGILAVGGATETATFLALKAWNMPRQSVTIFPAGDSASRIIALSAKAIDGTMLSYPDINEALRLGMHEFAKMSEVKGSSFPMNVMVVRRSFVEKNRDTVKRFQQAYAEGVYQFMNNKEKGRRRACPSGFGSKIPKPSKKPTNISRKSFAFPTRVSHEGLRNTLEIIAQRNPGGKVDMNISRYLDESTLDELEREGFFKRIDGQMILAFLYMAPPRRVVPSTAAAPVCRFFALTAVQTVPYKTLTHGRLIARQVVARERNVHAKDFAPSVSAGLC